MSRDRRRKAQRRNLPRRPNVVEVEIPEITSGEFVSVKTIALRLILAGFVEDDDRQARVVAEAAVLEEHGEAMLFGVLGYLLSLVTDGLARGYDGRLGAIDAVTEELATAVIADTEGRP